MGNGTWDLARQNVNLTDTDVIGICKLCYNWPLRPTEVKGLIFVRANQIQSYFVPWVSRCTNSMFVDFLEVRTSYSFSVHNGGTLKLYVIYIYKSRILYRYRLITQRPVSLADFHVIFHNYFT